MKKHLAAIVSAFAFATVPAFAQTKPALDPAAVQATRQMMEAMKIREVMIQSLKQAEQAMPAQIRGSLTSLVQNDKNLNAQQKQAALADLEKKLPALLAANHALFSDASLVDEMLQEMVPLYAETYTVDEIHQLSAFYGSPVGQKMLANMPKLMTQSMAISNRIMMPRIQKMMEQTAQAVMAK
ncbi:DUF2059 domain-containing protein [Massilia aerilata]|uniref:DUF2059 domain-containing protein n=1 Tax=Massilia aerilata TaxID=453817 RepID=A0ABW0RZS3_9BURK